jgi:iron complex transport system substrate-binding protein
MHRGRLLVLLCCSFLSLIPVLASAAPSRVVSLTLMTDEFLAELLPPPRIRAFSRSIDDPVLSNAVAAGQRVPGRAWLDLEVLVALKPDLVLAADWSDAGALDFLRSKGYRVVTVATPRSWVDVKARIRELGTTLEAGDRAQILLDRLGTQEKALERVRRQVSQPVSVLEYGPFGSSMAGGTLWDDLCALAGVKNAAAGLPVDAYGYAPLSRELLLRLNPDWLVLPTAEALVSYGQGEFLKSLQSDPLYRDLKAVKSGHLLFLSESLKSSTSHAALGAASALQHAAYPNLR